MRSVPVLVVLGVALCAAGCGDEAGDPGVMQKVRLDPAPGSTLLLNEDFAVIFNHPLDPNSVTRHSVRLVGGDGEPVAGEWQVKGSELEFSPAPVLARDLRDGGYLPGEELELVILGLPSPAALRSLDGRWLKASVRARMRVIDVGAEQQGFYFYDATPSRSMPIEWLSTDPGMLQGRPLDPGEPLVLRCREPLDPSSLGDGDFEVVPLEATGEGAGVRLELLRNVGDEQVFSAADSRALLAVYFDRPLAHGSYKLLFKGGPGSLTDLHGSPAGLLLKNSGGLTFRVGDGRSELTLDFVDDRDALPLVIEGADGTAHWSDDGRITVRYPAAAGDGSAGEVELGAVPGPALDVQATRLTLAAGVEHVLPEHGLVVLRAQGRISLAGRLVRRSRTVAPPISSGGFGGRPPRRSLSEFLAEALRDQPAWTVIIAGGDLVVDGLIECDTPLLLVAGGRVRGERLPKLDPAVASQFWILGDGGFDASVLVGERTHPRQLHALEIDAPLDNPLRIPLVVSVVSGPLSLGQPPDRWIEQEAVGGGLGGDWSVRFAPRELASDYVVPRASLTRTPWDLPGASCRIAVELVVRPFEPLDDGTYPRWDPPFVDRVRLAWSRR